MQIKLKITRKWTIYLTLNRKVGKGELLFSVNRLLYQSLSQSLKGD